MTSSRRSTRASALQELVVLPVSQIAANIDLADRGRAAAKLARPARRVETGRPSRHVHGRRAARGGAPRGRTRSGSHNSLRGATSLSLAVLVASLAGTSSTRSGSCLGHALGPALECVEHGARARPSFAASPELPRSVLVGAGLITLIGTNETVLWILLPVAVLVAGVRAGRRVVRRGTGRVQRGARDPLQHHPAGRLASRPRAHRGCRDRLCRQPRRGPAVLAARGRARARPRARGVLRRERPLSGGRRRLRRHALRPRHRAAPRACPRGRQRRRGRPPLRRRLPHRYLAERSAKRMRRAGRGDRARPTASSASGLRPTRCSTSGSAGGGHRATGRPREPSSSPTPMPSRAGTSRLWAQRSSAPARLPTSSLSSLVDESGRSVKAVAQDLRRRTPERPSLRFASSGRATTSMRPAACSGRSPSRHARSQSGW